MNKKVFLGIAAFIVIIAVAFAARYLYQLKKYKDMVSNIQLSGINLSTLENGVYTGSYNAVMIAVDVAVTVNNHKIESIELIKHEHERGAPAEAVIDRVVESQSLNVDTVSGATNSSRVILKAIDNALNSEG
ncbi:FMN-binding protein [Anaerobacterium chartisolvens]|nr:FMN-binding protein [Anaerobacterium chartisolvens]